MMLGMNVLAALVVAAGGDVVARVEGTVITRAHVAHRIEIVGATSDRPPSPEEALEAIVIDTILAREGERAGLAGTPAVAEYVAAATASAAADAFISDIAKKSPPDEKTLSDMFHATADSASFESLVFETEAQAAAAIAAVKGGASLSVVAGGAVVARLYANPRAAPVLVRGEIPSWLAPALFAASPGTVIGPLKGGNGSAVVRVITKEMGTEAGFAARRPALVASATRQAKAGLRKHLGQQLRAQAHLAIDEPFLRSLNGLDASTAQLAHEIARVNGRPVRYGDVHARLASLAMAGRMAGPEVKVQLASAEVERLLIEAAAIERGFGSSADVQSRQAEFTQYALGRAAAARIRASAPPPTEDEISAYYRRNAARYGKPFAQVLPSVAAAANAEKREQFLIERARKLRAAAAVTVDRQALATVESGAR